MRPRPLLVCLLLTLALLAVTTPAEASTTTTATCTDGRGRDWVAKATWGGVYTSGGVAKVSARSVRFTTKASGSVAVDALVTVLDGHGATVTSYRSENKRFSFDRAKRYLDRDPRNPPSAPAQTRLVLQVATHGTSGCTVTFLQPGRPVWTPSTSAPAGAWPSSPPAQICGDTAALAGPDQAPEHAVVVKKGDNSKVDFSLPRTTYWFAPGVHTLGKNRYAQIIPGDSSTFVGAPGAVLDGQGKNAYAFVGDARDVTISYLTVRNFDADRDEGTVNHDSATGWTIDHDTITGNGGAGLFLGSGNRASDNCLSDNGQYGFQVYSEAGPTDVVLEHNEVSGNNTDDWEKKVGGCGCTGGGKLWDATRVQVVGNYVHDNASVGIWADTDNDDVLVFGNWISDNDSSAVLYEISYNAAIRDNVIRHNQVLDGARRLATGDGFPDAAIYVSESGGDARLEHGLVGEAAIDISGNLVDDNYNGVTLWENADRFCGSPANTSSGDCTLVNPATVNLTTCTKALIAAEPYFSDCRWKTQDAHVHDNTFSIDRSHVLGCSSAFCGRNAVLSNYGSYPSWSPYTGDGVGRRITFEQGNVFADNTYVGGWGFVAHDAGTALTPAEWRAAPYGQDVASRFG